MAHTECVAMVCRAWTCSCLRISRRDLGHISGLLFGKRRPYTYKYIQRQTLSTAFFLAKYFRARLCDVNKAYK